MGTKGRTWAFQILVALAVAGAAPAVAGVEAGGRPIAARVLEGGLLVLPVLVNGTGPHPFLLDTGAASSIVDEDLARETALAEMGRANQVSPNGHRPVALVRATLAVGGVAWEGEILRTSLAGVKAVDGAIRGVLGQDVLRLSNWWIDHRRGLLREDPGGAQAASFLGERVPLHWQADRPAIDVRLPDQTPLRLVLDSAATGALVFRDLARSVGPAGAAVMSTHQGDTTVPLVRMGPLRAGRAVIPPFAAGVVEAGRHGGEDGLLPTALFHGVYFDNRAGAVVLNPRRTGPR
jgi:hypothetical protein